MDLSWDIPIGKCCCYAYQQVLTSEVSCVIRTLSLHASIEAVCVL